MPMSWDFERPTITAEFTQLYKAALCQIISCRILKSQGNLEENSRHVHRSRVNRANTIGLIDIVCKMTLCHLWWRTNGFSLAKKTLGAKSFSRFVWRNLSNVLASVETYLPERCFHHDLFGSQEKMYANVACGIECIIEAHYGRCQQ